MNGRTYVALIALLLLALLIVLSVRLETNLLDLRAFRLESSLFYVIASSFALGALVLFLLLTLLPQKSPRKEIPSVSYSAGPKSSTSKLHEAEALLEMGENDQAESILDQYTGDSDVWYVHKLRGDLYLNKGNGIKAEECYRDGLKVAAGTQRAFMHRSLGLLFEYQGRTEEAMEMYASALRINSSLPEPLLRLRQHAVEEQDWEKALFWQERVESNLSGVPDRGDSGWGLGIRLQLAWDEYKKGSLKTAQALVKYVLRMTESFPSAFLLAGEIQERLGHPAAALKTWERGVERLHHPVLMRRICDFYLLQNQPRKAITYLQEVGRSSADDYFREFCLGDLYLRLEMVEEAMKIFEGIHRRDSGWILNEMVLGEIFRRKGDTGKAADIFLDMVKSIDSTSVQLWQCYNCGTTYPEYSGYCIGCLEWNTINLNRNQAGGVDMRDAKSSAWPT